MQHITRRDWMKWCGYPALGANLARAAQGRRLPPSFILILIDDQGWTGTSIRMDQRLPESASDYYRTPNIERLARSGMRFSNGYAPSPVCSPTPYSIQFGQRPARLRMTQVNAEMGRKVDHSQLSIPKLVKQADSRYRTAHFGKWGIESEQLPMGYDAGDGRTGNVHGGMRRPHSAIREGEWKLLKFWDNGQLMLFNLADDLEESRDLASTMPGRAGELERRLTSYLTGVRAQGLGS